MIVLEIAAIIYGVLVLFMLARALWGDWRYRR